MTSGIAVLGGGAWGTALAALLHARGHGVALWILEPDAAERVGRERENAAFLPGVPLADGLRVTSDLAEALSGVDVVVGVVPSGATREVAGKVAPLLPRGATWVSATKGMEHATRRRMSDVVREEIPDLAAFAVLSGPSFAVEVARGQPTAVVIASHDVATARRIQELVSGPTFRAYASTDVVGVELAGSLKNVIAIAAGMLSGLGLGHDPMAALITRGLHEMTSLACAFGAEPRTMFGLAGLGDLVLTCTGGPSRNRRLGEMIARGVPLDDALAHLGQVAEGVATTSTALALAGERGIELPITAAVDAVLSGRSAAADAMTALMSRSLKDEIP